MATKLQTQRDTVAAQLKTIADIVASSDHKEPLWQTCVLLSSLLAQIEPKERFEFVDAISADQSENSIMEPLQAIQERQSRIDEGFDPEAIRLSRMVSEWSDRLRNVPFAHPTMALAAMVGRFTAPLDSETDTEFHEEMAKPTQDRIRTRQQTQEEMDSALARMQGEMDSTLRTIEARKRKRKAAALA